MHDELIDDEADPIEGYCVRCKLSVEIEHAEAVWTRRGMPATRGECPECGGTVFRMGRTDAHSQLHQPEAVQVAARPRTRLPQDTAYIAYAPDDEAIARQIADDLSRAGIATWAHSDGGDAVQWAGGVHPALAECARMVVVLSPAALADETVRAAWGFFREKRKPIVIAQVAASDPPDAIRRSPRFDFTQDYKPAFRQMVQALAG